MQMYNYAQKYYSILILSLGCFSACFAQADNPYGMFRGNIHHTGIYPTTEVSTTPSIMWKYKTTGNINSSAAIQGDNLFFGSGDGNLYCLNATDGALVWKYQTGGVVDASPAVADGIVFFGSHDGFFYAINTKDGMLKWKFKTQGEKYFSAPGIHGRLPKDSLFVDPWDFWLSSPAIQNNTIYFGSGDGYFYALNKNTGKQKWKFKTEGIIHSSPALAFGNVYFGGWDTYLHAVNAETGKEVWKFKTGVDFDIYNQTGITSSPTIDGNMLYFGCRDSRIYALEAKTGNLVWKRANDRGWISVTPVVYNDKVIYTSGSSQSTLALNKLNGEVLYQDKATAFFSSPALVGKTLYEGDFNGFIEAKDADTGKQLWTYQLPSSKEDTYHILNPDGSINQQNLSAAVSETKKSPLEIRFSLGTILSSPIVKAGTIYIGSTDGYFYAIE
jgi:eukaryotic-like serine/threonine-protein kinase